MANYLLRIRARGLRMQGVSVKKIAKELNISKSTASLWVRDVILSIEQLESLRKSSLDGAERGRFKNALFQKNKRIKMMEDFKKSGIEQLGDLEEREFLIAGLALYWAEGYKKGRRLNFCNSDPNMLRFFLSWLQICFGVDPEDIKCRVGINEMHKKRDDIVKEYWSITMKVPLSQFTKTSFKKVYNKKVYENFNEHYGTVSIEVKRPSRFYGKIIGLIEGLSQARVSP